MILREPEWIIAGPGTSREHLKQKVLSQKEQGAMTSLRVQTLEELCLQVLKAEGIRSPRTLKKHRVLQPLGRQVVLNTILKNPAFRGRFFELKRILRKKNGLRRIDYALTSGRMTFSHEEELQVFEERLLEGRSPSRTAGIRDELKLLALGFEQWCFTEGYWDLPLLLRTATEALQAPEEIQGWRPHGFPEKIQMFWGRSLESLEKHFFESLSQKVDLAKNDKLPFSPNRSEWVSLSYHRPDDAMDILCRTWIASYDKSSDLNGVVILIPEDESIRRTVLRSLKEYNIPVLDERDPLETKKNPELKTALIPLNLIKNRYDRLTVFDLLSAGVSQKVWGPGLFEEINRRGVRYGVQSYKGGKTQLLFEDLKWISDRFKLRMAVSEVAQAHFEAIERLDLRVSNDVLVWLSGVWQKWEEDLRRVHQNRSKRPAVWWAHRLGERLDQSVLSFRQKRPTSGVEIFRANQVKPDGLRVNEVILFGLGARFLEEGRVGDEWFSDRERQVLSSEFLVRSSITLKEERLHALESWLGGADHARWIEFVTGYDGKERESPELLREKLGFPDCVKGFASPRFEKSFLKSKKTSAVEVSISSGELPDELPGGPHETVVSSSLMDKMSRCAFQALAANRWKLTNLKDPEPDLWPEARGTLLHLAVKYLVADPGLSSEEALDRAWAEASPQGLLKVVDGVPRGIRRRLIFVLNRFLEEEKKYRDRAAPETTSLDEEKLELLVRVDGRTLKIVGRPDRIDRFKQFENGLWIIDYKSSTGGTVSGRDLLEHGYRIQLAIYALAAAKKYHSSPLGFQFVELTRAGKRNQGLFFERTNGKKAGAITSTTGASASLIRGMAPEEAWNQCEDHIQKIAKTFLSGVFRAEPRNGEPAGESTECQRCFAQDVCGVKRRAQ